MYFSLLPKVMATTSLLLLIWFSHCVKGSNVNYALDEGLVTFISEPKIVLLEHERYRRDAPAPTTAVTESSTTVAVPVSNGSSKPTQTTPTEDTNRTVNNTTKPSTPSEATVTRIPLLGVNGSGILRVNLTENMPKVSEPLLPDDNTSDVFRETPETIKAEHNLTSLVYDNHMFYNSTFIGNVSYVKEYWANITERKPEIHEVLSNSHRRATTLKLSFDFPFYGQDIRNITVATGGFIYTGEHVHNWLAATQYIAPLMANFDTTLTNDSMVKMYDDGTKFTVIWENVTLQEDATKTFTFAATLNKNGDIVFTYKDIPIPVQQINDKEHPVKVGISDAYLKDKYLFSVRHKTIYEYHRVSFKNHEISNNTILKLTALPTCIQYNTCESCANHNTGFQCLWCEQIRKCSSGTDRNKQDWIVRNCDREPVMNLSSCPAHAPINAPSDNSNTAYTTDGQNNSVVVVSTVHTGADKTSSERVGVASGVGAAERSPVGGAVAAFVLVALVCCLAAWILYAFKNPHTRSGQFLIKYRPSQWGWRRGEARYTAATIHM
ncbi:PREDICTED: plexin domain-containing protein 2 [Papilio polytes]|uniref:plexin domain-containing protein 2 n=1 Tax=Papilio polytes TaxID=76194 RepID=UPI0006768BA9|nr:PREDICTED: plexin domain-containing protein 2 [Papilio polytes]